MRWGYGEQIITLYIACGLYFQKFRYVAESEGRSANKEMEQFIKKRVNEFEKINGTIEIKKLGSFRLD